MKTAKKILALVFAVTVALSATACSQGPKEIDTSTELGEKMELTAKYVYKKMSNSPGHGDEYGVIGLLESGYMDYWDDRARNYVTNMNTYIQHGGNKIADGDEIEWRQYPLVFETYTACGIYADKTSNADLSQGITVDAITLMGGFDNKINCLTALECGGIGVYQPYADGGDIDRDDLIEFTLGLQKADGSFSYSGMTDDLDTVKVTADAVIALKSTAQTDEISEAAQKGAEYLLENVKPTDDFYDVCRTIIALNYADIDASDYVDGLLLHQYDNGAFAADTTDKKGNYDDAQLALVSLASQYRFENGLSKVYDFSESYGMTHNKLSPLWTAYLNVMKVALGFMICALIGLYILSRYRIAKWRKEGIYNEAASRMYTDSELEQIRKQKEEHEKRLRADRARDEAAEKAEEESAETVEETPAEAAEIPETEEKPEETDNAADGEKE